TGAVSEIIVVPCSQSLGWMDGYSPLGVDNLNRIEARNDPNRPMLVVLAHDGDNAWGGGYSYYMESVPNIVSSASGSGYVPTMVQKYLADHTVPSSDLVHVEDGAWVNADGDFGAPQFLNWNWPPVDASGNVDVDNGWAEDIRNWAVITATQNLVDTAEQIQVDAGQPVRMSHVLRPQAASRASEKAWHFFLGSLNSGYMYYGTALDMEVKPTVACNEANTWANTAIGNGARDRTGPSIWQPQRWPWNPGGLNFGPAYRYQSKTMPNDFAVWTFVHDASGLASVTLKWRVDADGANPLSSNQNETYAGGAEVGAWTSVAMTVTDFPAGNVLNDGGIDFFEMPGAVAKRCVGRVTGLANKLVDYYVEAVDTKGNVKRSPIQHVWVGDAGTGGGGGGGGGGTTAVVATSPSPVQANASVTITYNPSGRNLAAATSVKAHVGFNAWASVVSPDVAMTKATAGTWSCTVTVPMAATQLDVVFNDGASTWDNNGGQDWHFAVTGGVVPWKMDGVLDAGAVPVSTTANRTLWAGLQGDTLYLATQDAGEGSDVFML
ncbi:MAG: carbohydrate-binding protein, partial [Planctomycetota bacterium]